MGNTAPEPAELLEIAVAVVREAARTAYEMRHAGVDGVATKSTATDVVTAADRAVERQAVAALRRIRPMDTVLGEEYGSGDQPGGEEYGDVGGPGGGGSGSGGGPGSGGGSGSAGGPGSGGGPGAVRWILDPIDGTVNYLYGLPHYAVSLAAEVDGEVVAGVVRDVVSGDEWTATKGGGAYRAGRRLAGSTRTDLAQSLVATGFGYHPDRRAHQARVLAGLISHVRDIRRFGAAAVDLCLAAEGQVDAYYEKGLNAWDHAAGGLIAHEAGLWVGGLHGVAAGPDLVIAAPPALFAPLHDRLADLDAAGGP